MQQLQHWSECPSARISCRFNLKDEVICTPEDQAAMDVLKSNPAFQMLDPQQKVTKAFVCRYNPSLPLEPLLRLPNIVDASRWMIWKDIPTYKVLVTFRGPVPRLVHLTTWGSFPTLSYKPEPLRCYHCNRFGHNKARCTRPPCCGVCSGRHLTDVYL